MKEKYEVAIMLIYTHVLPIFPFMLNNIEWFKTLNPNGNIAKKCVKCISSFAHERAKFISGNPERFDDLLITTYMRYNLVFCHVHS